MIKAADKRISKIVDIVKDASFTEMKEVKSEEEVINTFLDRINEFKAELRKNSKRIDAISEQIEALSWKITKPNEATLKEINHLIVLAKNLKGTLIKKYVSFNYFRSQGIAKDEIAAFKNTIDLLTESYSDLDSIFFSFHQNNDFLEITKRLST